MVTALYRRYRPDTFADMIGQSQVTEPLMTALRSDRVNHAYLFSGPRGCGKTTSARILARCLNCAEGPTDTPCGKCSSCIELSRDGAGSLDVVEIDAASHNGVDDARDIRERAIFAPARDRYKIFILDEAHMVTPQGFNALLKIVEEPPEHVKFIFATTEPEKVIGTIRSRTHHYPFRLVPPAQMLAYVQSLCDSEGMTVAPGVLPLVVRAGGGSPRDTLSLLDQLMAGSEGDAIEYERAVALLGYTHAALLDDVIDAISARDAAGAFAAVDRVIQTGQDPRRFVEDLLERLRDLIVVAATSVEGAAAVLRGVPQDELDRMGVQAMKFGAAELSRSADIVNAALTEMTGATSPRLHLELMIARVLVPSADESERGALARVERLERRVGVSDAAGAPAPAAAPRAAAPAARPEPVVVESVVAVEAAEAPAASAAVSVPAAAPATPAASAPAPASPAASAPAASAPAASAPASGAPASAAPAAASPSAPAPAVSAPADAPAPAAASAPAADAAAAPAAVGPVTTQQVKDAWPQILEAVQRAKRSAWMVVFTAQVRSLNGDVLTLSFPSDNDVQSFRQPQAPGTQGVSEFLRQAIVDVLGIRVKFIARADGSPAGGGAARPGGGAPSAPEAETWPGAADAAAEEPSPARSTTAAAPAAPAAAAPADAARATTSARTATTSARADAVSAAPAAAGSTPPAAAAAAVSAPATPSGPVTEWAVVAIPSAAEAAPAPAAVATIERDGSASVAAAVVAPPAPAARTAPPAPASTPAADDPPYDDVPPPETEPPFEPPVPEEPAGDWRVDNAPAPADATAAPASRTTGTPAAATAPASSAAPQRSASAAGARTPTFQQPQRYGEAVVREILGATFLEEQPAPQNPGMR
ncbi:DNA polymerase III subunit gamma and tau [Leifsonia sp. F6_8S_P_1B]|uniref:DNA-directed DNA polymerase n=1 Tax=Leifsonia williamsii TaxID=3035919 RepID=A0ABT8KA20_9MICO|nr:DNA polymerase III subunit gamma and tau [Leifsonia williamsii]MDN4614291.1 DNA polymerase III subunit gamma and tau [Leifsonia williamsii]